MPEIKQIVVKKTHEITATEWVQIVAGFNEEFRKEKTAADLIRFYQANFKGYSYHGYAIDEHGTIAGFTAVNPTAYKDASGEPVFAGLSGSTFVLKAYRGDIFVFHDIYKKLRNACAADGCQLVLGVPNKNSFKYVIKLLGFKYLYQLPYYVLPLHIGSILANRWTKLADPLLYWLVWLYVKCTGLVSLLFNPGQLVAKFTIDFPGDAYTLRFNEQYTTIHQQAFRFTYRIYEEKGIRTAYLFDFTQHGERTLRALYKAVNHIIATKQADMILFVGRLPLSQALLFQLPASKEPQPLPLTIDVLLPETDAKYAAYCNPDNWSFGLMNFDVR